MTNPARMVSFAVLVAVLAAIALLSYRVMVGFLLPMFLAVLLVVIFGPMYRWINARWTGHPRLAAGLTTVIVFVVLAIPFLVVIVPGSFEVVELYRDVEAKLLEGKGHDIDVDDVAKKLVEVGAKFGVQLDTDQIKATLADRSREFAQQFAQHVLAPIALSTTQYLGRFLIGLGVMFISVYYFLVDGPGMIRTIMRLSPLDDEYEQQLITQFDELSRAVVLATLLSAFAQGILAGIGFYFAGAGWVFLLTMLAMLFAMIPFIGCAAIWIPVCLWLMFTGHPVAAVVLAIYCIAVVSMADNVIKPFVLHGRSNLHPLLALLSVLGGVQALGPIGIFVGPMVVAFLQTLLNMFHSELAAFGETDVKTT